MTHRRNSFFMRMILAARLDAELYEEVEVGQRAGL